MKNSKRIYYAQPVDFVHLKKIQKAIGKFHSIIHDLPFEIVAPYLKEDYRHSYVLISKKEAIEVIKKDYEALDSCDILFLDFSNNRRQAVGMIFELEYFWSNSKPTIVFVKDEKLAQRIWIIAVASYICKNWDEVRNALKEINDLGN